jgi:hypothetical protein
LPRVCSQVAVNLNPQITELVQRTLTSSQGATTASQMKVVQCESPLQRTLFGGFGGCSQSQGPGVPAAAGLPRLTTTGVAQTAPAPRAPLLMKSRLVLSTRCAPARHKPRTDFILTPTPDGGKGAWTEERGGGAWMPGDSAKLPLGALGSGTMGAVKCQCSEPPRHLFG